LEEASTAALAIVAAGLVPVLVLSISIARSRRRSPGLPVQAPTALIHAIPEGA
jgi:hypothetical protein